MKQIRYVVVIDKPDEWSLAELDAYLRHLTPLIKSADRDLTEKHG